MTAQSRQTTGCAVCVAVIPAGRLMCVKHWRLVPTPLQVATRRAWRAFNKAEGEGRLSKLVSYRVARQNAIRAVMDAVAAEEQPPATQGAQTP